MIALLNKVGSDNIGEMQFLNAGNVLNAFDILSEISAEDKFKQIRNYLFDCFFDEASGNVYEEKIKKISLENGHLQRFGEKIIDLSVKHCEYKKYNEQILQIILEKKEYDDDTLYSGTCATLNYLLSYKKNIDTQNDEVNEMIERLVSSLCKSYSINGCCRIYDNGFWESLRMDKGVLGIAITLLKYIESTR